MCRVAFTPMPFPYAQIVKSVVYLYALLSPFAYVYLFIIFNINIYIYIN